MWKQHKKTSKTKDEDLFEGMKTIFSMSPEELEEIRTKARENSNDHKWKQRGIYIVCVSCENEHSICVGTDKYLAGVDENGNPIIKQWGF